MWTLRPLGPVICLSIVLLTALSVPTRAEPVPTIAAAADLQFALKEIAAQFTVATGRQVNLALGSSGNFTHQIAQGAPFEMFLSADENYIFHLHKLGKTRDRGILYAVGRIGLFAPHGSRLQVDVEFADLRNALEDGRLKRFAIANPDHAPYGRAAQDTLRAKGLWERIEPCLVCGENASQATQFAASGASQGGIIPLALALAPQIADLGEFVLLPREWHKNEPLRQRMVLLTSAGTTTESFFEYLQQPQARAIFTRYGFVVPEDETD
jgi:molybdate transport system substrate-binding protein